MKSRKYVKAVSLVVIGVMALAMLCACGSSAASDVPVEDICSAVDTALAKQDKLVAVEENYIKGYMKMDVSDYDQYAVKINAYGANIDEYGIFKSKDAAQTKEVKAAVEAYLQLRLDSWMDEYMPEEKPKLADAEIKTVGNYVMYCILSDSDKSAAFAAFEDALK